MIECMAVIQPMQVLAVVLVHPGVPAGDPLAVDVVCHFVAVYMFFDMCVRYIVTVVLVMLVFYRVGVWDVVDLRFDMSVVLDMQVAFVVSVIDIVFVVFLM